VKARILPLDSDEHRQAQDLLPWFVNETLDPAEAAKVAAHLAHCVRCQSDAAAQAELRALPDDAEAASTIERDWARLRSQLGAAPRLPGASTPFARPWWKRGLALAVAIQSVVVLGLATALLAVSMRPEPYRALGAAPAAAEANAVAVFRADATEQQMRDALRAAGARIVGGPTLTDAYLLRLNDRDAQAIARLRAQPGVLSVESLQGEAAR
jgi:hypothetical protein